MRLVGNRVDAMNLSSFRASLSDARPAERLPPPLRALWHLGRNEWQRAHAVVQEEDDAGSAWVHAHLHRVEGDLSNARYWYSRAGKSLPAVSTDEEWGELVASLLAASE